MRLLLDSLLMANSQASQSEEIYYMSLRAIMRIQQNFDEEVKILVTAWSLL